jgi:hypothetical protein
MISQALKRNNIKIGDTLVEATSGNTWSDFFNKEDEVTYGTVLSIIKASLIPCIV